ncbi:hypothetical protein JG688_00006131 [Phytophthora aleatoria]|uniref:CEP76 C2 domain-containing protein n=1 Tax=Phytophthora aleatoria TaxID=2496075 RepID=A0A8J5INU4_9STRA|nr:hypothetical protein JG688_00006131 [Phytophthora aleatoria]
MDEQINDAEPVKETNSNEKIRSLRAAIDAKLHEQGIYEQIRELVKSKIKVTSTDEPNSEQDPVDEGAAHSREDQLIHDVLESEVVQQLLATVRSMDMTTPERSTNHEASDDDVIDLENERDVFLYLRLSAGKAFVDQLVELEQDSRNTDQEDVGLDEKSYAVDVMSPWEALCLVEEPVQLDLVKVTKKLLSRDSNGTALWRELSCELLAVHRLDWRRVLCSTLQLVHFPIQLTGRMKEPVGSLDIRADLLNCKRTPSIAREARSFLAKEAIQRNASNHSFYKYAKQWWDEYRSETRQDSRQKGSNGPGEDEYTQLLAQIGSRQRLVKMLAEDEEGRYRMVCKFVAPLRAPMAVEQTKPGDLLPRYYLLEKVTLKTTR